MNQQQQAEKVFWDSGAFSLMENIKRHRKKHPGADPWAYYDTPEFWQYMEGYVRFVKENDLKLYANVDAIYNPELTFRNQKWLEKQDLSPVPVVHYGTPFEWLEFYINRGKHPIIGLGGRRGEYNKMTDWLNTCFNIVCRQPSRLPRVKIHGFGFTIYEHLFMFPFWSVDSVTYMKAAAYGSFLMPYTGRGGQFDLHRPPFRVSISCEALGQEKEWKVRRIRPFTQMSPGEQAAVIRWLEEIEVPLGSGVKQNSNGQWQYQDSRDVPGITTEPYWRRAANLKLFDRVTQIIPQWPWPFRLRKGFGLV